MEYDFFINFLIILVCTKLDLLFLLLHIIVNLK